jgi:2-dehydropantoate 2-reductase
MHMFHEDEAAPIGVQKGAQRNMRIAPMRVCVAGAGAIGTTLAVRLSRSGGETGVDISVLARGNTLSVIRNEGLALTDLEGTHRARPRVGYAADLGEQDVIFLCAKAQDLPSLADAVAPLLGPETLIVPVVNGIPWWYFEGEPGRFHGRNIHAVDPDGRLKRRLPSDRVIGAVTYITAERPAPGWARTSNPLRMIIGEIDHRRSARVDGLGAMLEHAGIATQISERLRDPLWTKIIANLTAGPLSVVTGATLRDLYRDPLLAHVVRQLLNEALLTAAVHGARIELDPPAFLAMGAAMGAVRTSMLQDFEKGLPLELASICDAVIELAELHGLPMRVTRNITMLARFKSGQIAPAAPQHVPTLSHTGAGS